LTNGHVECVSVNLKQKATPEAIIDAWNNYLGLAQEWQLPSAPLKPIHYKPDEFYPQPRFQRDLEKGMAVSIGQLRASSNFDFQFTLLSHNTLRGAGGGAIVNAELLVKKGYVYW